MMSFSVTVEISQPYHARWIDSIRQTSLGGLILDVVFVWSDRAWAAAVLGEIITKFVRGKDPN